MQAVTTIGLDIAKSVFSGPRHRHAGNVIIRAAEAPLCPGVLPEAPPWPRGGRACATSHHWSRELKALGSYRAADAASLREALRQAAEERCRDS